jgi:hypothetical protein
VGLLIDVSGNIIYYLRDRVLPMPACSSHYSSVSGSEGPLTSHHSLTRDKETYPFCARDMVAFLHCVRVLNNTEFKRLKLTRVSEKILGMRI